MALAAHCQSFFWVQFIKHSKKFKLQWLNDVHCSQYMVHGTDYQMLRNHLHSLGWKETFQVSLRAMARLIAVRWQTLRNTAHQGIEAITETQSKQCVGLGVFWYIEWTTLAKRTSDLLYQFIALQWDISVYLYCEPMSIAKYYWDHCLLSFAIMCIFFKTNKHDSKSFREHFKEY